jgi:hypothetical protein
VTLPEPAHRDVATTSPDASPDAPKTTMAIEPRLRMPPRPPVISFPEKDATLSRAAPAAQPVARPVPPADPVKASAPERADPADAIDWLLKKRQQESDN